MYRIYIVYLYGSFYETITGIYKNRMAYMVLAKIP